MDHAAVVRVFERFDNLLRDRQQVVHQERPSGNLIRKRRSFDQRDEAVNFPFAPAVSS
jgi:hypothetical protein